MQTFGARLREARERASLSQQELAERIDVAKRTVVNWEHDLGSPSVTRVSEICDALGLPHLPSRARRVFVFGREKAE